MIALYPPFRKWVAVGTLWVYSDPHFQDPDMPTVRKNYISDDEQVARINSKVGRKDTIIFLGDIGDTEPMRKIRGYKVLITGNHDKGVSCYEDVFDEIYDGPLFIAPKLLLSHEPIFLPFAFNVHGHDHAGKHVSPKHLNVCAELIDYTPVNLTRLIKRGLLSGVDDIHRMTADARSIQSKESEDRKK